MKKKSSLRELIQRAKCFSGLDETSLKLLEERMTPATFEKGAFLCREGDAGDRMFLIESGEAVVLKRGEHDIDVQINVIQAGEVTGTMSLFQQGMRTATLQALKEVRAWVLDHETFRQLMDQPGVAHGLLASMTRYLCHESALVAKLLSRSATEQFRVAFFDSKPYIEESFRQNNPSQYALDFFEARLSQETVLMAAGYRVICVFVNDALDARVLEQLHGMGVEMIALRCAGYNNVDLEAARRYGISIVRVPAYSPYAVAEHAVALMMALNRRVHRAYNRVRENNFSLKGLVGFDMHDKVVGVIGTGKIGACLLSILKGFGCRLLAYDRSRNPALEGRFDLHYVELEELFALSDIISLHAPLTPQTHHMIDAVAIEKMKPGVMLINTSRGPLIDARALLQGLKSGKVGFAGLDVYEEEGDFFFEDLSDQTMPDDVLARLTTFNNVIITSHQAFLTREALTNIAETTMANIREFETGKRNEQLSNCVAVSV